MKNKNIELFSTEVFLIRHQVQKTLLLNWTLSSPILLLFIFSFLAMADYFILFVLWRNLKLASIGWKTDEKLLNNKTRIKNQKNFSWSFPFASGWRGASKSLKPEAKPRRPDTTADGKHRGDGSGKRAPEPFAPAAKTAFCYGFLICKKNLTCF